MIRRLTCGLALLPLLAAAATRDDYARQWPLSLRDADAGAYRVVLDPAVYRSAQRPDLGDVDVLDADGMPAPAALFAPAQPLAAASRLVALPWFPLPAGKAAQAQDIAVISERAADGSVRRVETRISGAAASPATTSAWLLDASRVHAPIVALQLHWTTSDQPVDVLYRVEGSGDLRDWRPLQAQAPLLDLVRDGRHLLQRRIPLDGSAKYLRLLPAGATPLPALAGVDAELAPPAVATPWQWRTLTPQAHVEEGGRTWFQFVLDGRYPVEVADIALEGNSAGEWTLQSRDDDDAPWQTRAGPWMAYRVGGARGERSPAQALDGVMRDRQWRLSSSTPMASPPVLRLGFHPEVLVFVAQGRAPFTLVAGSARASRRAAPLPRLVDALRAQRGEDWQPADAALGTPVPLAGDAALTAPRDWKTWLLWAVLATGALVVAGFALSLLHRPAKN